jgi:glutathione S-transferase
MRAYTLITAPDTPVCHKARTYLRWRNVPFSEKPATALVLRSEVRPRLRRVDAPLLIAADQRAWNDTRVMFDALDPLLPGMPLRPGDIATEIETLILEAWLDQLIAPAASFWLWEKDSRTAASHLVVTAWPDRPGAERERLGRIVRQQILARFDRLGYRADGMESVEARIRKALSIVEPAVEHSQFLFGRTPTVADCSLFAIVLTLRATMAGDRLLDDFPAIAGWSRLMSGPHDPLRGRTHADGRIPPALKALVQHAAQEFIPIAIRAGTVTAEWADSHAGHPVLPACYSDPSDPDPEHPDPRALRPADAWLLQRLCERIRAVEDFHTSDTRVVLEELGLSDLRNFEPHRTIRRRNFRFELDMVPRQEQPVPDAVIRQVLLAMDKAGQDAAATSDVVNLFNP